MSNLSVPSRFIQQIRQECPLTIDELRRAAPSIFATDKHDSRSARYAYIPTIDILTALAKEGFQPFMATQSRARDDDRRDHTKHMIRLRHADQHQTSEVGEVVLINSHDGSSSYQMSAGVYRQVCGNGLCRYSELADVRIPHKGDVHGLVIEGAFTVLDQFGEITAEIDALKSKTLSLDAQRAFATTALELRYGEDDHKPVSAEAILAAKRAADRGDDVWSVFNRVQENLVRGNVRGRTANGGRTKTREITGIDQNMKLNRALWALTQRMAELVG